MKNKFRAYFDLTESEYKTLWDTAVFSFDTNVLFDLYRTKKNTADTLLSLMQQLRNKDQVWIPYQVAKEFFRGRVDRIKEQGRTYSEIKEHLERSVETFKSTFPTTRHPFIPTDDYGNKLDATVTGIIAHLTNLKQAHIDTTDTNKDETLKQLLAIFDGNIGEAPFFA